MSDITRMDIFSDNTNSNLLDYGNCSIIDIPLGGAMGKFVIVNKFKDNKLCIVKLQENDSLAVVSEFVASKLANLIGIDCQNVDLGYYEGKLCCIIEFLTIGDERIHSYCEINDSSCSDVSDSLWNIPYTLDNIIYVLKHYKDLNITIDERLIAFQRMCYFDTLIGNFDRHWGNWGFKGYPKRYSICPLYDNGSSLFPNRGKFGVNKILRNEEELYKRTYTFPTSAIKDEHKNKLHYKDLVTTLISRFGKDELIKFCKNVDKINFKDVIYCKELKEILSEEDMVFLTTILKRRYEGLLKSELID